MNEKNSLRITELLAYEVENDTFTSFDTTSGTAGTNEKTEDDIPFFRPRELLDKESVTRIPITVPTTIGAPLTHPADNGDIRIKSNTPARIAHVTTEVEEKMKELLSRTLGFLNGEPIMISESSIKDLKSAAMYLSYGMC
uniref:Reverse transcriptase domain-containing protein n=1 Tax=Angiostrongylus cantonensis TaxID=6313 RepID=A0A0K0D1M3_ANGCA